LVQPEQISDDIFDGLEILTDHTFVVVEFGLDSIDPQLSLYDSKPISNRGMFAVDDQVVRLRLHDPSTRESLILVAQATL
jgi:hypothetical protein